MAEEEIYHSKNGKANATKNNKDNGEGVKNSGHGGGLAETVVTTVLFVKMLNRHVLSKLTLKNVLSFLIGALSSSSWKNDCLCIIN
jgi:hypothetical protein